MNKENRDQILNTYMTDENIKHAYLFELKSNDINEIIDLAKEVCDIKIDNQLILDGASADIKVLFPDGNDIKKGQILSLQEEFLNTSISEKKRIYIISDASKLNKSSANTLLKFLEEPPSGVIAFLVVNNRYNVISTISSRCIFIPFVIEKEEVEFDEISLKIIEKLESKKTKFYVNLNEEEKMIVGDRQSFGDLLRTAILVYEKALLGEKQENVDIISNTEEISNKIKIILEALDLLDKNVNQKMLLNKILYKMYGGGNNAWCFKY